MYQLDQLKSCFETNFTQWLLKSNNPKIGPYLKEDRFKNMLERVEKESLNEILNILIQQPLADYFWYGYPENGGELLYSLPQHEVVPAEALRVNKDKIKVFLRDIKIDILLNTMI